MSIGDGHEPRIGMLETEIEPLKLCLAREDEGFTERFATERARADHEVAPE